MTSTKQFVCRMCKYDTDTKFCLLSHLQKKKVCNDLSTLSREDLIKELTDKEYNDVTYDCKFCKKKFNDRSNRTKHHKVCKKASTNVENNVETKDNIDISSIDINQMRQEIREMRNAIGELTNHLQQNPFMQNTIIQNNLTSTVNLTINNYGNENITHLTHEFLSQCLLNPKKGLPSLIESIHYNKDFPENHNIRFKSWKKNLLEKCIDSQWRECDASNTLDELIRKGYRILNTHYIENHMNDPSIYEDEFKQKLYEKFRFLMDTTSHEYNAVKRDLRILIRDRTLYVLLSPATNDEITNEVL